MSLFCYWICWTCHPCPTYELVLGTLRDISYRISVEQRLHALTCSCASLQFAFPFRKIFLLPLKVFNAFATGHLPGSLISHRLPHKWIPKLIPPEVCFANTLPPTVLTLVGKEETWISDIDLKILIVFNLAGRNHCQMMTCGFWTFTVLLHWSFCIIGRLHAVIISSCKDCLVYILWIKSLSRSQVGTCRVSTGRIVAHTMVLCIDLKDYAQPNLSLQWKFPTSIYFHFTFSWKLVGKPGCRGLMPAKSISRWQIIQLV